MPTMPDLLTVTAAARHEGVSRTAIYGRLARKKLVAELVGGVVFVRVDSMSDRGRAAIERARRKVKP